MKILTRATALPAFHLASARLPQQIGGKLVNLTGYAACGPLLLEATISKTEVNLRVVRERRPENVYN
jgi:hypothetical protein